MDIWTNHTPWPFSELPKSYSALVKRPLVWRLGYYGSQPRIFHDTWQVVSSLYVRRTLSEFFAQYDPDLVVSVHPLMQMVPLMVLRQREKCAHPFSSPPTHRAWPFRQLKSPPVPFRHLMYPPVLFRHLISPPMPFLHLSSPTMTFCDLISLLLPHHQFA